MKTKFVLAIVAIISITAQARSKSTTSTQSESVQAPAPIANKLKCGAQEIDATVKVCMQAVAIGNSFSLLTNLSELNNSDKARLRHAFRQNVSPALQDSAVVTGIDSKGQSYDFGSGVSCSIVGTVPSNAVASGTNFCFQISTGDLSQSPTPSLAPSLESLGF